MDYQNFFNRDFFPTPVEVIDQMMQFSEVQGKIVLEPSAGSGNIVDWLRNMRTEILSPLVHYLQAVYIQNQARQARTEETCWNYQAVREERNEEGQD